jgi:hypothetical protein
MSERATFARAIVALTLLLLIFTRRSQRLLERARPGTPGNDPVPFLFHRS